MSRFVAAILAVSLFSSIASATGEFQKEWKTMYLDKDADAVFVKAAKKAGCNVCHIKGEKKTERNEYGMAVHEFLNKANYTKEKLKENPELVKEIVEGIKKAGEKTSSDEKTFAAKIEAGELPATDSGL